MQQNRVVLSLALLSGFIVASGAVAVNLGASQSGKQWADGSPMPLPKPTGVTLVADGSPMPLPKPTLVADGSPMPLPKPTEVTLAADGSPMPLPKPTGVVEAAA